MSDKVLRPGAYTDGQQKFLVILRDDVGPYGMKIVATIEGEIVSVRVLGGASKELAAEGLTPFVDSSGIVAQVEEGAAELLRGVQL